MLNELNKISKTRIKIENAFEASRKNAVTLFNSTKDNDIVINQKILYQDNYSVCDYLELNESGNGIYFKEWHINLGGIKIKHLNCLKAIVVEKSNLNSEYNVQKIFEVSSIIAQKPNVVLSIIYHKENIVISDLKENYTNPNPVPFVKMALVYVPTCVTKNNVISLDVLHLDEGGELGG